MNNVPDPLLDGKELPTLKFALEKSKGKVIDKAVLSDAAYAARFKVAANPNLPIIRDLKKAGVEVFVCGQSLHDVGFKAEEVAEDVPVADSAMLVLVNKQTDGYAYIPAP